MLSDKDITRVREMKVETDDNRYKETKNMNLGEEEKNRD